MSERFGGLESESTSERVSSDVRSGYGHRTRRLGGYHATNYLFYT